MTLQLHQKLFRGFSIPVLALLLLCLTATPGLSQRDKIVIKMASLAPINSDWDFALKDMAEKWEAASNGMVELRIYGGGQGGEEKDVIRRIKLGQFQAGGFTVAGLQNLTNAVVSLAIPMLMEDQEDLRRVREVIGPKLEAVFERQGFVLLHWADLGWMRFFTPGPSASPDAVSSYVYVQWGEDSMGDIWRDAGFSPGTRLPIDQVSSGLQTGMVNAINTAPLVVAGYQWFPYLDYMIDLRWAPLTGATLVDKRTWDRIPADLRTELMQIAKETGATVRAQLAEWEGAAIESMKSHGLEVIVPDQASLDQWEALFQRTMPLLIGPMVPEDWYAEAVQAVEEGRGG